MAMSSAHELFRRQDGRMHHHNGYSSLAVVLDGVAQDRFPAADGRVTIVPAPSQRDAGVLGFTGHAVIFIDADPSWVVSQPPEGDLAGPLSPAFLQALCGRTGPLWAQVAPAILASVRAILAAGFQPAGAEAHLTHRELGI